MRPLAIFALLTVLTPWAAAQRGFSAHAAPAHSTIPRSNSPTGNFALGRNAHALGFRRFSPYASLPFPFLSDFFDPDDIYSTGYPVASQPPVILLQASRALAGSSDYPAQPNNELATTQPLMIELQNGRYVRVASPSSNGEPLSIEPGQTQTSDTKFARRSSPDSTRLTASNSITQAPEPALPPAVLVFRDGHTEEVRDYAIADGILYARGDYYTDGYWNKKIAISTLNVPQTLEANNTRNVKFTLPTSPNEVITRP